LEDFQQHVKEVEAKFWAKFHVFREWQYKMYDFHSRFGYVELLHGFRRGEYLKKNEIVNTPIQGTAFHLLLWSFIEVNKLRKEEAWITTLPDQIHDSMFLDLYPPETEYVLQKIKHISCEKIREEFEWVNLPLKIEAELSTIDGNWFDMEEINHKGYTVSSIKRGQPELRTITEIEW
jgi:DNA polymerase I-like protein with 3'-5' exonuclease and polymerase domains